MSLPVNECITTVSTHILLCRADVLSQLSPLEILVSVLILRCRDEALDVLSKLSPMETLESVLIVLCRDAPLDVLSQLSPLQTHGRLCNLGRLPPWMTRELCKKKVNSYL